MEEQKPKADRINFMLGFFAGLALVSAIGFFVLLAVVFGGDKKTEVTPTNVAAEENTVVDNTADVLPVRAIDKDDNYQGDLKAKVQLIVYDDFECPYCLRHEATLKQIMAEYGDKIVYAFRHFPLSFHENAQKAAEASECAAEQGKFWEMHDQIFADNEASTMGVEQFIKDAKSLGLNVDKFTTCLNSGKYAEKIQNSMNEAATFGVKGTPGNFINGQLLSGALPYEQLKAVIDAELAK